MESLVRKVRPTPGLLLAIAATSLLPLLGGGSAGSGWLVVVVALVASVVAHELSHAVIARRMGMTVEEIRVSLLGGVTRYTGPDPGPADLRRIALAGPKTSLALAAMSFAIVVAEAATGRPSAIGSLAAWSFQANLVLGVVNLLPFGSLDGAALRSAARRRGPGSGACEGDS